MKTKEKKLQIQLINLEDKIYKIDGGNQKDEIWKEIY